MTEIELTCFVKTTGPLTKRITLGPDGKVVSDGSACVMSHGTARRLRFETLQGFADHIGAMGSDGAIATGALQVTLPDEVDIVTKQKLEELGEVANPGIIARCGSSIVYRPGQPALALLDHDTKGMPASVQARLAELGGFWPALVSMIPELADVGHVLRRSTSAGLYRTDTGERLPGSDGVHVYLPVQDGADIERFLKTLHARCWLAGLGWMMVGAGGQLLDRSIVDRMVGAPERLVFEGTPILIPPLAQDRESRRPIVCDGEALNTAAVCPPLTILEQARLRELQAKASHRLAPESTKARQSFIQRQSEHLAQRTGLSAVVASRIIEQQCRGTLLSPVVLAFDDPSLGGSTVNDVLSDPARFEGCTLADPLEGVEYGRCKAKVMRRPDGTPWIHSFAHGRSTYELKRDADAVREALEAAPKDDIASTFVELALAAELDPDELEQLRNLVAKRAGVGKRAITNKLKNARERQREEDRKAARERRTAERQDSRPQLDVPSHDDPWLP